MATTNRETVNGPLGKSRPETSALKLSPRRLHGKRQTEAQTLAPERQTKMKIGDRFLSDTGSIWEVIQIAGTSIEVQKVAHIDAWGRRTDTTEDGITNYWRLEAPEVQAIL